MTDTADLIADVRAEIGAIRELMRNEDYRVQWTEANVLMFTRLADALERVVREGNGLADVAADRRVSGEQAGSPPGTEHTPGPWEAYHWATAADECEPDVPFVVTFPREVDGNAENVANALLIAAAPDLLRACQVLEKWARSIARDVYAPLGLNTKPLDEAVAVILKATGSVDEASRLTSPQSLDAASGMSTPASPWRPDREALASEIGASLWRSLGLGQVTAVMFREHAGEKQFAGYLAAADDALALEPPHD